MIAAPMPWTARAAMSRSIVGRRPACSRGQREEGKTGGEEPAAAEAVGQRPEGQDGRGERERVRIDDPLQAGEAGVEVLGDARERGVDDRDVEHEHRGRGADDRERPASGIHGMESSGGRGVRRRISPTPDGAGQGVSRTGPSGWLPPQVVTGGAIPARAANPSKSRSARAAAPSACSAHAATQALGGLPRLLEPRVRHRGPAGDDVRRRLRVELHREVAAQAERLGAERVGRELVGERRRAQTVLVPAQPRPGGQAIGVVRRDLHPADLRRVEPVDRVRRAPRRAPARRSRCRGPGPARRRPRAPSRGRRRPSRASRGRATSPSRGPPRRRAPRGPARPPRWARRRARCRAVAPTPPEVRMVPRPAAAGRGPAARPPTPDQSSQMKLFQPGRVYSESLRM